MKSLSLLCVGGRGQPMLAGGSGRGGGFMEPKKFTAKKGRPLAIQVQFVMLILKFNTDFISQISYDVENYVYLNNYLIFAKFSQETGERSFPLKSSNNENIVCFHAAVSSNTLLLYSGVGSSLPYKYDADHQYNLLTFVLFLKNNIFPRYNRSEQAVSAQNTKDFPK